FDFDDVTVVEQAIRFIKESYPAWSAGYNNIADIERGKARYVFHDGGNIENELIHVSVLSYFPVHSGLQTQLRDVFDVIRGHQPWTKSARRWEIFTRDPL